MLQDVVDGDEDAVGHVQTQREEQPPGPGLQGLNGRGAAASRDALLILGCLAGETEVAPRHEERKPMAALVDNAAVSGKPAGKPFGSVGLGE